MTRQSPKPRVYHGPTDAPLENGACPQCGRVVAVSFRGRRRLHKDRDGRDCTGGGVIVGGDGTYLLDDLPPVIIGKRNGNPLGNPWSGTERQVRRSS